MLMLTTVCPVQTNPVPMGKRHSIISRIRSHNASPEAILLQDPLVHAAIIFGRGRFQNGVIVQPKQPFEPNDEAKLEEFRNAIWCVHSFSLHQNQCVEPLVVCRPTVERANNFAPSHSRIFKEVRRHTVRTM